jgi:hypothetical protein
MEVRLDAVGDKAVSKLRAQWNNIILEIVLGRTYRNVVIKGIRIKYVTPLIEFKKKQRESLQ